MLHKLRMMFSKGLGFLYVLVHYHYKKKKNITNHKILVIFGGHIGNAILNIDTLLEIKHIYPPTDGWQLYILCNEKIRKTCEMIADMSGYQYIQSSYPYEGGGTRFSETFRALRAMHGMEFETIIVNMAHIMPLASYLVAVLPANRSIGVFDDIDRKNSKLFNDIEHNVGSLRWYFERAYTDAIRVPYNTQEVQRQKLILQRLGNFTYQVRIYPISKLCEFTPPMHRYFTVTLDTASLAKRWAPEKFAAVINALLERYDYVACFTGGKEAEPAYKACIQHITYKERTVNCIGKTSFAEWVELLRASSFHIGVDSGSIHVAASVGTQAFCLIGVWDGERVFPYQIEREQKGTAVPICIYMKGVKALPCYACVPLHGLMGSGNAVCLATCRRGRSCECLAQIEAEDVLRQVEDWIDKITGKTV